MNEAQWLSRPFFELFCDAIELARGSKLDEPSVTARASILTVILSIEAGANCFLDCYPMSKHLKQSIDKFSPLDKYDFLFSMRMDGTQSHFDRGSKQVQNIKEMINLRNKYVHPKPKANNVKLEEMSGNNTFSQGEKLTPQLKIPEESSCWNGEHARCVINAVADFLSFFLIKLCKYDSKEATRFLSSEMIYKKSHHIFFGESWAESLVFIRDNWKANIIFVHDDYLPIYTTQQVS
ncbi:hypothetical protein [Pseudoalteromonas sp. PPB1]|uniref:hypothetical protein n=1 Tax=Pseudoalteromonas sp. PPB1 TaxID=2756136 RepID=UPI0018919FF7|nr:hypothetical protein [Pseudoalteromonas sp. PPB1]